MPPGMIMTRDTPGQAMRDMAAVDPTAVSYRAPVDARGDQPLEPRIENGVKVYDLEASVIEWNILPYERVMAYAFNHQVPGPRINLTEGDHVRFNVTNHLPEPTTIHWHGLIVPNAMDGPAEITQDPIPPGGHFTYDFVVQQAGTFFYHSHTDVDRQQALGLYGALIVAPKNAAHAITADQELVVQLQEWNEREGYTYPAMPMEGVMPNFFTINGKSYPSTETVHLKVGQHLLVRFIGSQSAFIHPMHIHGGPFTVVAIDGVTLPESARYEGHGRRRSGRALRRHLDSTRARQVAPPLPHQPSHDERQRRGAGRRRVDADPRRESLDEPEQIHSKKGTGR